jgi:hypothetical protein
MPIEKLIKNSMHYLGTALTKYNYLTEQAPRIKGEKSLWEPR